MRKFSLIIAIILIIILIGGMFFYFTTASPKKSGEEMRNPASNLGEEQAILQFNPEYIDYLVYSIGGWRLHNPALSDDTPKIKIIADGDTYVSEIINGKISTEKKDIENEDIIIRTTKKEIVDSLISNDMGGWIKQSVQERRTIVELKASYTTLFSKGYLSLYKELTGKSFTGSTIRIFGQV